MTIDEAIKHCEEKAEQLEGYAEPYRSMGNCEKCAEEHRQLAEWLKELKAYREQSKDAVRRSDVFDMIINVVPHKKDDFEEWMNKACRKLAELSAFHPESGE